MITSTQNHIHIALSGAVFLKAGWALLLCMVLSGVNAAPNLHDVTTIQGVKLFRDHEQKQVFYYLKAEKKLMMRDGKPDFRYDVNRYIGKKLTGDSDEFRVRGVVKFQTTSAFINTSLQQIKDALSDRYGMAIELRAAPVTNAYNKLIYSTIEEVDGELESGEIANGLVTDLEEDSVATDETAPKRVFASQKQRFTIGLNTLDANFFWDNFEDNNLQLSLAYGWDVKGVVPATGESTEKEQQWQDSMHEVNNAMPIDVSPTQYPSLFNKNELWQRADVAYSNIRVMCYDFINLEDSDLYYVQVELRFTTLRNQTYREKVRFVADSDVYEKDVHFKLVNDLKGGYEYRVRRLSNEGEVSQTEWLKHDDALLDVSLSEAEVNNMNKVEGSES